MRLLLWIRFVNVIDTAIRLLDTASTNYLEPNDYINQGETCQVRQGKGKRGEIKGSKRSIASVVCIIWAHIPDCRRVTSRNELVMFGERY